MSDPSTIPAGSPQAGTQEYFDFLAREYMDVCGYSYAERPPAHAHFQRLIETLIEAYQAGHEMGEAVGGEQVRLANIDCFNAESERADHLRIIEDLEAKVEGLHDCLNRKNETLSEIERLAKQG